MTAPLSGYWLLDGPFLAMVSIQIWFLLSEVIHAWPEAMENGLKTAKDNGLFDRLGDRRAFSIVWWSVAIAAVLATLTSPWIVLKVLAKKVVQK